MNALTSLTDLDAHIWQDELEKFVPKRVFDIHTHIYRWSDYHDPDKDQSSRYEVIGRPYPNADWRALDAVDHQLMSGREVDRLAFPFPFPEPCAFEDANRFVAGQVSPYPASGALMLVQPSMSAEYLVTQLQNQRFLGFKPYRLYSSTGDTVDCRITDFMPLHQIEVAHRHGLIIMMHLSKRDGLCDPDNLRDLPRLCAEYPNVKWILAHCGRSYAEWPIRRAAHVLKILPNVWYDTSSVCDPDSIAALIETVGADRVMYGSDDLPIGVSRGKYIAFGYAWAFLAENNHSLDLSHCDGRMTFVRYEQLRAMRQACTRLRLTEKQIEDLFFNTARALVDTTLRVAPA
jgi:Amidohydrolase